MNPFRIRRAVVVAALIALAASPIRGQTVDTAFVGRILGRLTGRADTMLHYAAYIPRSYRVGRPAALLLVLDPHGNALGAMAPLTATAERLGWLVLSSYDMHGDGPSQPNVIAANGMLADAFSTFSIDTSRIYLAGFSGTARDAWVFGYSMSGHVAGILSADAGEPADPVWRRAHAGPPPFDVAMTTGTDDANYTDILTTADSMHARSTPVRVDVFPGGEEWPPADIEARALGWLAARSMARHLAPMDSAFVDSVFAVDSSYAVGLEATHRPADAADQWRAIAVAWAGLHDGAFAAMRRRELEVRPDVQRLRAERDSMERGTRDAQHAIVEPLLELRRKPGVPDLRRLTDELHIVQYQRWAADASDSVRAAWAGRLLADIYAQVSFFEPEAYIQANDPSRALAMLDIATEIHPDTPAVCLERARVYAARRDVELTVGGLKCALAGHAITMSDIRADPRYRFVLLSDEFQALIH